MLFLKLFSIGYNKMLTIVPYALQWTFVAYCIYIFKSEI